MNWSAKVILIYRGLEIKFFKNKTTVLKKVCSTCHLLQNMLSSISKQDCFLKVQANHEKGMPLKFLACVRAYTEYENKSKQLSVRSKTLCQPTRS